MHAEAVPPRPEFEGQRQFLGGPYPWPGWQAVLLAVAIVGLALALSQALAQALLYMGLITPPGTTTGDSLGLQALMAWQGVVIGLTLSAGLRGGALRTTLRLQAPPGGLKAYAMALAAVLVFEAVTTTLEAAFVPQDMLRNLAPFVDLARGPLWWLGLVAVGIGAPLSEELLFRGFLLPALAQSRLGIVGAAVVSSTLWTLLHLGYSMVGLIEVFSVGLLFSWLLWRTGSLRVTILCHALYNTLIILALRFTPLPALIGG